MAEGTKVVEMISKSSSDEEEDGRGERGVGRDGLAVPDDCRESRALPGLFAVEADALGVLVAGLVEVLLENLKAAGKRVDLGGGDSVVV